MRVTEELVALARKRKSSDCRFSCYRCRYYICSQGNILASNEKIAAISPPYTTVQEMMIHSVNNIKANLLIYDGEQLKR